MHYTLDYALSTNDYMEALLLQVLHINCNYITSALHQTMIEHMNNNMDVENYVFVPVYDKKRTVVKPNEYANIVECFNKRDRLLFFYKQRKIIFSAIKNYNIGTFDCIHAYTLFSDGNAAMELSRLYNKPYVVAVRNTDVNYFFHLRINLRRLGVEILRNASAIFFLSPAYKNIVFDKYIPLNYREEIAKKSYIIPNGIDDFWINNRFKRDSKSIQERIKNTKRIKFMYVGRIDSNKNIEFILRIIEDMKGLGWDCNLSVAGEIIDRRVYKKLKKYNSFIFLGQKNKEELLHFYRDADVFIMLSHKETFGLVYSEAISQGLPVVYTRGQGFDGQFDEGQIGYGVSDKNISEAEKGIIKICEDYSRISENCTCYCSKFDWDAIVDTYIDIYNNIV